MPLPGAGAGSHRHPRHDLQVFHIPKTIDNDLRVHDHTPGYGSAARFVATAMIGDNFDNRSLPGIKIDVLMGRNAGYLTAATALARQHEEDGPHLIYIPEQPIDVEKLIGDVDRIYSKRGRCLIAVSEGIVAPDGRTWFELLAEGHERDAHAQEYNHERSTARRGLLRDQRFVRTSMLAA